MLLTISHVTMKALLHVTVFYTPISDLWESLISSLLAISPHIYTKKFRASGKDPIVDVKVNML